MCMCVCVKERERGWSEKGDHKRLTCSQETFFASVVEAENRWRGLWKPDFFFFSFFFLGPNTCRCACGLLVLLGWMRCGCPACWRWFITEMSFNVCYTVYLYDFLVPHQCIRRHSNGSYCFINSWFQIHFLTYRRFIQCIFPPDSPSWFTFCSLRSVMMVRSYKLTIFQG